MRKTINYHNKIGNLYTRYLKNISGIRLMDYKKKIFIAIGFSNNGSNRKRFIKKIRSLGYPCVKSKD